MVSFFLRTARAVVQGRHWQPAQWQGPLVLVKSVAFAIQASARVFSCERRVTIQLFQGRNAIFEGRDALLQ